MPLKEQVLGFFAWLAMCMTAMFAGGYAVSMTVTTWYPTLNKPSWTPPEYVFAPVWIVLYTLMATSAWIIWKERKAGFMNLLVMFMLQLVLSTIWVYVFFAAKRLDAAAVEIIVLWLVVLAMLALFYKSSKLAGILLVPYFVWVTFAALLNVNLWRMNL